jgi:hypothetical protein
MRTSTMTRLVRKLALALLAVAAVLALAACGNKEKVTTSGDTEGSYLDVGPLTYQIQISRQLNPKDPEDRTYLEGTPPALAKLPTGQTWFGVFIRVSNEGGGTHPATRNFAITDTQNRVYRPIPQVPGNPFTYRAGPVAAGGLIPQPDTVASQGVIQGTLVLFRLPLATLDNRPLELVVSQGRKSARVTLDV